MKIKKNLFIYLVVLPLSFYLGFFGFVEETEQKYEEGCIEKRRKNSGNRTLVFIKAGNKIVKYHLDNNAVMPNDDLVGQCVIFKYYRNSIGNKIILDISGSL